MTCIVNELIRNCLELITLSITHGTEVKLNGNRHIIDYSIYNLEINNMSEPVIKWDDNGKTGRKIDTYSNTMIYTPQYGFRKYLEMLVNILAWDPKNFQQNKLVVQTRDNPLNRIYPGGRINRLYVKREEIRSRTLMEFRNYLDQTPEAPICSDFEFLARLSLKRVWNNECSMCLEDEHMGQTCGCGLTEIVIFRPCGHSMCLKPCFNQFMTAKGQPLARKTFTCAEGTYMLSGNDADLTTNFSCPVCRTTVTHTFNSSDCGVDDTFDNFFDSLIFNLRSEFDLWYTLAKV